MKTILRPWRGMKPLRPRETVFHDFDAFASLKFDPQMTYDFKWSDEISLQIMPYGLYSPTPRYAAVFYDGSERMEYHLFSGSLPEREVGNLDYFWMNRDLVLRAVEYFFETGQRKPDLQWYEKPFDPLTEAQQETLLNK